MSRACSATSFLSRAFCFSSSLRRLASSAFIPPYWLRHRCQVCSETSRCLHTAARSLPSPSSRSPSRSLRMTCSGVCLRRFAMVVNPLGPIIGDRTLTTPGPLHGDQVIRPMSGSDAGCGSLRARRSRRPVALPGGWTNGAKGVQPTTDSPPSLAGGQDRFARVSSSCAHHPTAANDAGPARERAGYFLRPRDIFLNSRSTDCPLNCDGLSPRGDATCKAHGCEEGRRSRA